jgi:hypothetical protein
MRFLAYTTLAYGAQGLSYYVWCYPGHQGGIVRADGTPSAIYGVLKATNREFVKVAEQYQPLKWIGAYLKGYRPGALPPGATVLPNNSPFDIRAVSNTETYKDGDKLKGVLFGLFGAKGVSPADATLVLLTNLDYAAGRTYTVTGPGNLSVFDAATGKWTATGRTDAALSLAPGGGALVRLGTTAGRQLLMERRFGRDCGMQAARTKKGGLAVPSPRASRADDGVSVWNGLGADWGRTGGAQPKNRQTFGLVVQEVSQFRLGRLGLGSGFRPTRPTVDNCGRRSWLGSERTASALERTKTGWLRVALSDRRGRVARRTAGHQFFPGAGWRHS